MVKENKKNFFHEYEIVVGIIIGIIVIAILLNIFLVNPSSVSFCGDGKCSKLEIGECQVDCDWCGDGYCQEDETCSSCSNDCKECSAEFFCGDKICNINECESGCWKDCGFLECENGVCEIEKGEDCINSPNDCKCEDGYCNLETKQCIYQSCGNKVCEFYESYLNCPNDCEGEIYQEEDLSDINYPIIFVHGHSPSEVEGYSPTTLEEFQEKLTEEGYENMGIMLPSDYPPLLSEGIWSKKKISVIMTYYSNKYDKLGGVVGPDDNQHIDIYSQRLRGVVDVVKHNTGKNRVIIIAHSMGGLVSRNYIKNYGGLDEVDKLVMIGTPNQGTYGYIGSLCGTIIAGRNPTPECEDMKAGSDFLINLNRGDETPGNIDYLTIVGLQKDTSIWCPSVEKWDSVICSSSVKLNGAENFYYTPPSNYEGSLHRDLVYPSKIPEIYNKIVGFIND